MRIYTLLKNISLTIKAIPKIELGEDYLIIGTTLVQWGDVSITLTGGETNVSRKYERASIRFKKEYSQTPKIFLGQEGLSNYLVSSGVGVEVTDLNSTEIVLTHTRGASTTLNCDWLAIGKIYPLNQGGV